ncbi:MAG: hypothetical protein FWD83_08070, partial [Promicromonosporaceae bacterium]|nr:hypothetical protein [Promicromonosporaceae bacterium]
MARPLIKICGLRRAEDVRLCARYGVSILGFVVEYPRPVPWNLSVAEARELLACSPVETCVVTGGTTEHVYAVAAALRPTYLQLHWEIAPTETMHLVEALRPLGVKLIQTIFPHTPAREAREYDRAGVHALLLDPRTPVAAEQGGPADLAAWRTIQQAVSCPVILAGGITP